MKKLNTTFSALEKRAEADSKIATWLLLIVTSATIVFTAAKGMLSRVGSHPSVVRLRANSEAGDQFVSWILVILAVITIGLIVVAAINGWFSGRIGELGT